MSYRRLLGGGVGSCAPIGAGGTIERTISRLTGYRRMTPRYERNPRNNLAFSGHAAALTCYKRLIKLTT